MKTGYFITMVFLAKLLFGQMDYTPLMEEGMGWGFTYNEMTSNGMYNLDFQAKLGDEEIIYNDKIYRAIEISKRERIDETPVTDWSSWETEFYLNENIEQRKVYIYYPETTSFLHLPGEFLLYDFNLEVDDVMTLEGFVNDSPVTEAVIHSITYDNVFGFENVRTYHLTAEEDLEFKVYEGIGTSFGLMTMAFMLDFGWTLTHYGTMNNQDFNIEKSILYPNPFQNRLQISNTREIKEFQLFDLQGKLISSDKNLEELNSKLTSLKSAVYFLKIQFENNQSETHKLIKNK